MEWFLKNIIYQSTVRKHLSLVFIGFLLGVLIFGFVSFSENPNNDAVYRSGFLGIFVCYAVFYSNTFLSKLTSWEKYPGIRLLLGILWSPILALFLILLAIWMYFKVLGTPLTFTIEHTDISIKLAILLFCISVIYNIIYFALYSYNHYAKGKLYKLQIERKQAQLQLNILKAQLSPHFLFNSMNSLTSLFQKDVVKAESFIRALAKSYEYTLAKYQTTLVSIKEELSFVNAYYFLIRTRFGNGFQLNVDLNEQIQQSKIPPMTLQILVENAVKHNIVDPNNPITLKICIDNNKLIVSNNKVKKKNRSNSTKIGLKNIESRYKILSNSTIEVIDKEQFTIKLPVIL